MCRAQDIPIFPEEDDNRRVREAYSDANVKANVVIFIAKDIENSSPPPSPTPIRRLIISGLPVIREEVPRAPVPTPIDRKNCLMGASHPQSDCYGICRREAREATSLLACLTLRSPQDKKGATARQHLICPEFDVKFRIETILERASDCKCSETVDMVQANPNRNGDKQCVG
jgi:hypothetical protein